MKVVLFCGGYGMRMRNSSDDGMPKPMQMVGPRPLIWHVMRYYAHFGHKEFILCLGYGASHIKNYFLTYQEAASNDFVMRGGRVELMHSDISDWSITFVDTGLESAIGERLRRVRGHLGDGRVFPGQLRRCADRCADGPHDRELPQVRRRGFDDGRPAAVDRSTASRSVRQGRSRTSPRFPSCRSGKMADSLCFPRRFSTCCLPEVISSRTSAARSPGRDGCSAIGMKDSGNLPIPSRNGPSSTTDTTAAIDRGCCGSTMTAPPWARLQGPDDPTIHRCTHRNRGRRCALRRHRDRDGRHAADLGRKLSGAACARTRTVRRGHP